MNYEYERPMQSRDPSLQLEGQNVKNHPASLWQTFHVCRPDEFADHRLVRGTELRCKGILVSKHGITTRGSRRRRGRREALCASVRRLRASWLSSYGPRFPSARWSLTTRVSSSPPPRKRDSLKFHQMLMNCTHGLANI